MDNIFKNTSKIEIFASIEKNLLLLDQNSSDESIESVIKKIPANLFHEKEDLMMICQIFGLYARLSAPSKKGNAIKLFEKIIDPIKSHLQDESSFFWEIFGGHCYLKYYMYKEGLISIDQVILSIVKDDFLYAAEYFLPEIIENRIEIFEKELKYKFEIEYTEESLNEFKNLRQKHFRWLRESNDFNDQIYKEIEKNQLRYSIKIDDVDLFQKILSNLNIPIETQICESVIENTHRVLKKYSLIEFAVEYDSINIFKYLFLNGAKIDKDFYCISNKNYEIYHLYESTLGEEFTKHVLNFSVLYWNDDMINYSINNLGFDYIEESDIDSEYDDKIIHIVENTFFSFNFIFFNSILLPFFRKNDRFVSKNIYTILGLSFYDRSGFIVKEFLKFPNIDVNHHFQLTNDFSLFVKAVSVNNTRAVELLLSYPELDLSKPGYKNYLPIFVACVWNINLKMLKIICNHPKIDLKKNTESEKISVLALSCAKGNIYCVKYLTENFEFREKIPASIIFNDLIERNHFYILKTLIKYYLKVNSKLTPEIIYKNFNLDMCDLHTPNLEEKLDKMKEILAEVNNEAKEMDDDDYLGIDNE